MDWLREWAGPLAALISIGGIAYTWLTSRSKGNEEKLKGHSDDLKEHDRRIQELESEFHHLPSKDDINEVRLAISAMNGQLGRMEESAKGVNRSVRRIENFLFKNTETG